MCINGPSGKSFILDRSEWLLHYFFIYRGSYTAIGRVQDPKISDCNGKHLFSRSYVIGHINILLQVGGKRTFCIDWREGCFQTASFSLKESNFVSLI